ncbi:hypothetical protein NIES2104_08420 [Leptolyngbya sp. NIES-2104]|nr:hypothetical protein NIES2104_08420 [Leptolyngbya sp. NIES-2104]
MLIVRHLEPLLNKGCRTDFGKGGLKQRSQPLFYSGGNLTNCYKY